jgi:transposase
MEHYAGIDVSLELSSVCVVDAQGKILKEAKVASSCRSRPRRTP